MGRLWDYRWTDINKKEATKPRNSHVKSSVIPAIREPTESDKGVQQKMKTLTISTAVVLLEQFTLESMI